MPNENCTEKEFEHRLSKLFKKYRKQSRNMDNPYDSDGRDKSMDQLYFDRTHNQSKSDFDQ